MNSAPTRRTFLQTAAAAAPAAAVAGKPRNIIFILTDDHRYDLMSCAGHPWIRTPNLDRLAQGGVRFRNAFVTTSLCSPSRASILSGQYVHAHRVFDNFSALPAATATFPKVLQGGGYETAFIGKWHMGDSALAGKSGAGDDSDMPQPGFDRWIAFRGQGVYRDPLLNFDGRRERRTGYITDILTEEALRFLNQAHDRPFALYLSHKAVHAGFEPAPRHRDLYRGVHIEPPRSARWDENERRTKPAWLYRKSSVSRHGLAHLYAGEFTLESLYLQYARTLAGVDESTGKILDALAAHHLLEDTLIVYMGDNGFMLGEQGLVDKRVMHEPSMRVPVLMHCPALFRGGRMLDQLALNIDICPTLVDAAGLAVPESVHGRSLLPLLKGERVPWREEFVYEYFWDYEALHTPGVLGLRTARHSFMEYQGIWDINELYDIEQDPEQMHNLLAGTEITTQPGGWYQQIKEPRLKELTRDLLWRKYRILEQTGGHALTRGPVV